MKKIVSLITVAVVFFIFCVKMNAFMAGNETEKAFCNDCPAAPDGVKDGSLLGSTPTISELIARGGNYLFKSSSYMDLLFSEVEYSEISGPDYQTLQDAIDPAIDYMEKAKATYLKLKNLAAETPYNQDLISKLMSFDYDAFQQKNGLLPTMSGKVKDFLGAGDVRGVYNEFHSYAGQILDLLYLLKKDAASETFPKLSTLWSVNQKCMEFKLFGQYVAEVFYNL